MKRVNVFESAEEYKLVIDKDQYILYRKFTEGARRRYQSAISSRPFRVNQSTGEMTVTIDLAEQRYLLLKEAISGWKLFKDDKEVPFGKDTLEEFLEFGNSDITDRLEIEVKRVNSWLAAGEITGAVEKEIERLQELKKIREAEEEKKAPSLSRPEPTPEETK